MKTISFWSLIAFSAFLRLFLIIYGELQDTHMEYSPLIAFFSHQIQFFIDRGENLSTWLQHIWESLTSLFTRGRILFGLISGSVFFFCTGIFFFLYRWEFLNEALLYHLTRTDPRHNFSVYFYHTYLHYEREFSVAEKLVSFLPQIIVQLVLIFRFGRDLPLCWFLQTVAFVSLNKVITAQYFVWFVCLLPLILLWSSMKLKWEGLTCILLWIGAQCHWLMWGYLLEFKEHRSSKKTLKQGMTQIIVFCLSTMRIEPMTTPFPNSNASGTATVLQGYLG